MMLRSRQAGFRSVLVSVSALVASVFTLSGALPAQRAGQPSPARIAVFDARTVFDSMPERAAAQSAFALEQAKARTLLAAATDSPRMAVDEFSRVEERMTPRAREATTMHLRARELLVDEMIAGLDEVILRRNEEIQAPMRARMLAAVRELRQRGGYDLIIDLSRQESIIDADPRIDVTFKLVAMLRAAGGAPTAGGAPRGAK